MPIPAVSPAVLRDSKGFSGPQPPDRVVWQRTFVSITGNNGEGEEIPLTGFSGGAWPSIFMLPGATGLDSPPMELHSDDSPNLDGGMFRGARATQREIMLPVFIHGIDRRSVLKLKRQLINALNPKRGYCVLKFVESNGDPRYLYCYYKSGVEGSEATDQAGFTWAKYGIQLTAFDPWFYSDEVTVASWKFEAAKPFFNNGGTFLPPSLSEGLPSETIVSVTNPGDIEAWPTWEITGPVKQLTLTNVFGESFQIGPLGTGADVIPTGRTLIVDSRPGYKTLKDDLGTNYYPLLAPNPVLWNIPPGDSLIDVDLVAGSGPASISISFNPRYESY
ncbi:phage tail domain-containing protein [Streptomyces scabiei]|uniref:phage tail domain-containing protein n=1 Tax=Streptomyces scabiei TaxID=1930 RepID=UPI0029A710E2|nr:phage tail domain-containing protein [Streptomyces scabiei]MDX3206069.1 phage tail family protein [Streptomyces scabiei]